LHQASIAWEKEKATTAAPGPSGFFYFSGHGASSSRTHDNYVIPLGTDIETVDQLEGQALKVGDIADTLAGSNAQTIFVVADACRTVLSDKGKGTGQKGFYAEDKRAGELIAFSTDPGNIAQDTSTYSHDLAAELRASPGAEASELFKRVRIRVRQDSAGVQNPWDEDGLNDEYYFRR
jgi:uncharacterized caspase-like protein